MHLLTNSQIYIWFMKPKSSKNYFGMLNAFLTEEFEAFWRKLSFLPVIFKKLFPYIVYYKPHFLEIEYFISTKFYILLRVFLKSLITDPPTTAPLTHGPLFIYPPPTDQSLSTYIKDQILNMFRNL